MLFGMFEKSEEHYNDSLNEKTFSKVFAFLYFGRR